MGTRKNKKSNKRFRKTRSKRQRGGTIYDDEDLVRESKRGNTDFVKILLEYPKIDVNAADGSRGVSATMWASFRGHAEIVEMLLEKGADVNAKDNNGNTALNWAMMKINNKIVEILANKGADVNAKDNYGDTPLNWAVKRGEVDLVKILLATGRVDVNEKDYNGNTALIIASKKGYVDIITMLLDNGADVNEDDDYGRSAIDWAKSELARAMRSARPTNLDNYNYIVRMLHKAKKVRYIKDEATDKAIKLVKNRKIPSLFTLASLQLSTKDRKEKNELDLPPPKSLGGKRKTKKTKKHL